MRGLRALGLAVSFLLVSCGLAPSAAFPTSAPVYYTPTPGHLPDVDWTAYHDNQAGFSIQHPRTWQRRDSGVYPVVFALRAAPGTTLIEKTMEINVTEGVAQCRETRYNTGNAAKPPEQVRGAGGLDFLRELGGGIAAGNIYDTVSYSRLKGTTCITISFVLHSSSSGVYVTEPASFDKAAESQVFDKLLATFRLDP